LNVEERLLAIYSSQSSAHRAREQCRIDAAAQNEVDVVRRNLRHGNEKLGPEVMFDAIVSYVDCDSDNSRWDKLESALHALADKKSLPKGISTEIAAGESEIYDDHRIGRSGVVTCERPSLQHRRTKGAEIIGRNADGGDNIAHAHGRIEIIYAKRIAIHLPQWEGLTKRCHLNSGDRLKLRQQLFCELAGRFGRLIPFPAE